MVVFPFLVINKVMSEKCFNILILNWSAKKRITYTVYFIHFNIPIYILYISAYLRISIRSFVSLVAVKTQSVLFFVHYITQLWRNDFMTHWRKIRDGTLLKILEYSSYLHPANKYSTERVKSRRQICNIHDVTIKWAISQNYTNELLYS